MKEMWRFVQYVRDLPTSPTWTDVAMLGVQVLGLFAAAGAFVLLWRQIRLQRQEMHSSLRPLVVVQRAHLANGYVRVLVQNLGPGPARDVQVFGWPRALPAGLRDPAAVRAELDRAKRDVNLDAPELVLRLGALGPQQMRRENMAIGVVDPAIPPPGDFLVYFATYRDVYLNEFPSGPRKEWEAGHLLYQ